MRRFATRIKNLHQKVLMVDSKGYVWCFPLSTVKEIPFGGDRIIFLDGSVLTAKDKKQVGELRVLKNRLNKELRE